MDKHEILAKSRIENKDGDEREMQILANASKVGMSVGAIVSVVFVILAKVINEPILGLSALSVYFLMFGSRRLYQFIKTKEKARLSHAVFCIVFGVAYFIGILYLGLKK